MGRMVAGKWTTEWYEPDPAGRFQRPDTVFRNWVKADGSTPFEPEVGRYHLYASWACPWAHRILIALALKGLEHAIDTSFVAAYMGDDGWTFDTTDADATIDHVGGKRMMREVYMSANPNYSGRVTVPVLWDRERSTIVNNESRELLRMIDMEFEHLATERFELFPAGLVDEVDAIIEAIYEPFNNGVYRAGFAGTQSAYEEAVQDVFATLDHWEKVLGEQKWLAGDTFTAADVCMFTTLVRFDAVYYGHFKCGIRRLTEYPNLWAYTRSIYQMPQVRPTVKIEHCKRHYYGSHESINPKLIVPLGPSLDFDEPHGR